MKQCISFSHSWVVVFHPYSNQLHAWWYKSKTHIRWIFLVTWGKFSCDISFRVHLIIVRKMFHLSMVNLCLSMVYYELRLLELIQWPGLKKANTICWILILSLHWYLIESERCSSVVHSCELLFSEQNSLGSFSLENIYLVALRLSVIFAIFWIFFSQISPAYISNNEDLSCTPLRHLLHIGLVIYCIDHSRTLFLLKK